MLRKLSLSKFVNYIEMGAELREKSDEWTVEHDRSLKRQYLPTKYCMSLFCLNIDQASIRWYSVIRAHLANPAF